MAELTNNKLSLYQLYIKLQNEYLVCLLRSRIYPLDRHKSYWANVAEKKKEKIEDIAIRNALKSIFNDKDTEHQFIESIYGHGGLPNFYYPNKKVEDKQRYWDIINYYSKGAEVKCKDKDMDIFGSIIEFDYKTDIVRVAVNDQIQSYHSSLVTRLI